MAKLNLYIKDIKLYIILYIYKFNISITRIHDILEYIKVETLFLNCRIFLYIYIYIIIFIK